MVEEKYVTVEDCKQISNTIRNRLNELPTQEDLMKLGNHLSNMASKEGIEKLHLALWGENGRGGMVKDVGVLKQQNKVANRVMSVLETILTSVITAGIIAYLLGTF